MHFENIYVGKIIFSTLSNNIVITSTTFKLSPVNAVNLAKPLFARVVTGRHNVTKRQMGTSENLIYQVVSILFL